MKLQLTPVAPEKTEARISQQERALAELRRQAAPLAEIEIAETRLRRLRASSVGGVIQVEGKRVEVHRPRTLMLTKRPTERQLTAWLKAGVSAEIRDQYLVQMPASMPGPAAQSVAGKSLLRGGPPVPVVDLSDAECRDLKKRGFEIHPSSESGTDEANAAQAKEPGAPETETTKQGGES